MLHHHRVTVHHTHYKSTPLAAGLYYMFYIRLKEVLAADGRPQFVVNLMAGTTASVAATLLTQPFDVVRLESTVFSTFAFLRLVVSHS